MISGLSETQRVNEEKSSIGGRRESITIINKRTKQYVQQIKTTDAQY